MFSVPLLISFGPGNRKTDERYTSQAERRVPTARFHICENSEHEIPQGQRPEGGGEDDVATQGERGSQEHGASVDVGGYHHGLLGQEVVHPVLTVELHLREEK